MQVVGFEMIQISSFRTVLLKFLLLLVENLGSNFLQYPYLAPLLQWVFLLDSSCRRTVPVC